MSKKKAKPAAKKARRERVEVKPVVVPPPWSPADHKAEYLKALKTETRNARLALSGQLLAVMHGKTVEKDGDVIPAPVQNLGQQLKGLVEQVATKKAIATFDQMKVVYDKARDRAIQEKEAQDAAIAKATRAVEEVAAAE